MTDDDAQHFLFEVTGRCAASCHYCYARHRPAAPDADPEVLARVARRLHEQIPIGGVTLIGGEPLAHPELARIAASITALGVPVAVTTSGLGWSAAIRDALLGGGVRHFEVSLDTLDGEVFRALGCGDDVEPVKRAIADLARRGAHVTVSAVLQRPALEGLDDLIDFCFAVGAAGVSLLRRLYPTPTDPADAADLDHAELVATLERCDRRAGELGLPIACSVPLEPCLFPIETFRHLLLSPCACGRSKWVVDTEGYMRVCELSSQRLGNLLERPFLALRESADVRRFRQQRRQAACARCDDIERCGGGCRFVPAGA